MKQRMLGIICALAIAITCASAGNASFADPYYELKDSYQITSPTEIGHTVSMIDPTGQTITKDKCTSKPGDYTQAYFRPTVFATLFRSLRMTQSANVSQSTVQSSLSPR